MKEIGNVGNEILSLACKLNRSLAENSSPEEVLRAFALNIAKVMGWFEDTGRRDSAARMAEELVWELGLYLKRNKHMPNRVANLYVFSLDTLGSIPLDIRQLK